MDEGYLLGAGDRLKLDIFGVPEYSGEYQVLADGTLNLPLAGGVTVQGLTLAQASRSIEARYREWLTRPVVTVSLTAARPVQIAVSGEVVRPGAYTTSLAETGIPTLTKMVQIAGGVTPTANLQQVQILRRRPGGGGTQTMQVNLMQLIRSGDLAQDIQLRDGDSVVIPARDTLDIAEANQIANSSLAASDDRPVNVLVAGEVNRPGPHSVTGQQVPTAAPAAGGATPQTSVARRVQAPTVTRAIQIAGGITNRANLRDIEIRRTTQSGTEQTIKINLMALLQAADARQDIPLQEGDRIIIPTASAITAQDAALAARASFSPDLITVNVVGEVERPGAIQLPPNTTLNQAVLAAGGFKTTARRGEVEFVRLQPNGSVDKRSVRVDFARGLDEKSNPGLQNYDTIVVGKNGIANIGAFLGNLFNPLAPAFGLFNLFR
jgi:polysaccharide export outer membrane protein